LAKSADTASSLTDLSAITLEHLQRPRGGSEQLQRLADIQAIRDVLALYCRAQDRCDLQLLQSVFHADAVDHHGGVFEGSVRDFCGFAIDKLRQCETATHHLFQTLIDVDGDRARTEAYALAFHRIRVGESTIDSLWSARICDRFERRDGFWRIAERQVVYDWNHDVPSRETWGMGFFGAAPSMAGERRL
jgi:hypothetical protein